MDNNEKAKPCKIVFFGEDKVGKTNIIRRFCHDYYDDESERTCGNEIYFKTVQIPGTKEKVSFIIWDTALEPKYRDISIYNFTDADVIVLTYKEGDRSFNEIKNFWYKTVKQVMEKKPINSQCDNNNNDPNPDVINLVAKEFIDFRSVSAKENKGINELFMTVGKKFLNQNTSSQ